MVAIFVRPCYHPCMFIRIKSTPNSPRKSVQIVASVRDGNKVRQKIMRHVGVAQNDAELARIFHPPADFVLRAIVGWSHVVRPKDGLVQRVFSGLQAHLPLTPLS